MLKFGKNKRRLYVLVYKALGKEVVENLNQIPRHNWNINIENEKMSDDVLIDRCFLWGAENAETEWEEYYWGCVAADIDIYLEDQRKHIKT